MSFDRRHSHIPGTTAKARVTTMIPHAPDGGKFEMSEILRARRAATHEPYTASR